METKTNLPKGEENNTFLKGLENIAKASLDNDEELIVKWWVKKYNLPPNHPLLLNRHIEDLFIEMFQDETIANMEQKETKREEDLGWEEEIDEAHDYKMKKLIGKKSDEVDLSEFQKKAKQIEETEKELEEEINEEFNI